MNPFKTALDFCDLPSGPVIGIWGQFREFCLAEAARFDEQPRHSPRTNPFEKCLEFVSGPVDPRLRAHFEMLARHWDNQ